MLKILNEKHVHHLTQKLDFLYNKHPFKRYHRQPNRVETKQTDI